MTAQTQVIIDWLTGLGWDTQQESGFPLYPGPEILSEPDQAVHITGGGGPGFLTDEASIDAGAFQARVRGPADDAFAAESAAQALDDLIRLAPFPVQVDGTWINTCYRLGNGPTPMPLDPADRRFEFTTTYVFVTGS